MLLFERKPTTNKHFYFCTTFPHVVTAKCKNLSAICKSRNGESENGIRGMMEMRRITVEIMGMRGIRIGIQGIWGGNEGNHDENLSIGEEMINKKCGEE